ncbi:carbohydrate kinase family protein [Nocardioides sp.]|uniref:carbohydrate kinase family protein n=1 Tax=Nocardioides sp. TaxID=35761 RepID=UPI002C796439|nr:carbohydrate kinase family protein [Nocardioides sp.]HXH80949.1 carbohydrate kinase family protein [Nocardioides sp.]
MADVVVHGPASWNLVVDLDELPPPRPHMRFADAHRELLGGTSAGKAAHLRDLGVDVELHTVLGTDAAADSIEAALLHAGIPVVASHVEGPSERHLNLMDRVGGRVSIYLDVPVTPDATMSSCAVSRLLDAVTLARAVVLDLSQPSRDVIEAVAALGVPVWTDVHDYDGTSDFHAPFLDAAEFVFMNADKLDAPPQEFLRTCVDRGARIAVCTLGAEGAVAVDAQGLHHHVRAEPVPDVVDTNGAGDGFMAGFLVAHLDGADIAGALRAGARQAARSLGTTQLNPILKPPGSDWTRECPDG